MISSKLFEEYFGYLSPSDMYKALNETTGSEENKVQANTIENRLTNFVNILKNNPTSDTKKLKTETACQKLLSLFFTLMNKINEDKG